MTHPTTDATTADEATTDAPAGPAPATVAQKLAAELLGTFVLVLVGCAALVFTGVEDGGLTMALAFGLTFAVLGYAFGRVSGAHLNPAVSLGAALGGRVSWASAGLYAAAQLVGAVLGAGALFTLLQGLEFFSHGDFVGQNFFGDESPMGISWWAALLMALLLTAVLVMLVLALTDARNEHPALAPLAVGLGYAGLLLVAAQVTAGSLNPARSIGPALFAGTDAIVQLWLFVLAPLLGAAAAGLLYPVVFGHGADPVPGSGLVLRRAAPAAVPGYGAPDQYQQQWNQQAWESSGGWGAQATPAAAPIIQDGWMWDAARQQWVPAPPEYLQPASPQQQAPQPGDTSSTQIRPPEGQ